MLSIIVFSGVCFARYEAQKTIIANTQIAVPILTVEGKESAKVTANEPKGYYDFIVKNYKNKKVSEVAQNYTIEVISNTDESIGFKLYQGEKQIKLDNKKTNPIRIKKGKKDAHKYRLEVVYDSKKSNSQENILEDVKIKIHSEQARP